MSENEERRAMPRRQQDAYNDGMAQNLAALAALVEAAATNVRTLSEQVAELRKAIVPRAAITAERDRLSLQRRRAAVAVALFAVALIWAQDEHIERCSPGARAEHAVEALLSADPRDPSVRDNIVEALRGRDQPKLCDAAFPLHDHDGNGWPRPYNLAGLAVWGAAAVSAYLWTRPRRREFSQTRDDSVGTL